MDTDSDNHISYEEFVRGMSVFLKGRLDERIKCMYIDVESIIYMYNMFCIY